MSRAKSLIVLTVTAGVVVLWVVARRGSAPTEGAAGPGAAPVVTSPGGGEAAGPGRGAGVVPAGGVARERLPVARLTQWLDAIRLETDLQRRTELIRQLIAAAEPDQLRDLLEASRASQAGEDVKAELLLAWAKADPASAASWARALTDETERLSALEKVAYSWAGTDLPGALTWLNTLPVGAERTRAAEALAYEAALHAPMDALKLAVALEPGSRRDELVTRAVREWATHDPLAAADWAAQIGDETVRIRAVADAALVWAQTDPAAAARFASENLPVNETLSETVIGIVQTWAATDPKTAGGWAAAFAEGELQNLLLGSVFTQWPAASAGDIPGWIDTLATPQLRDRSRAEYAAVLAATRPQDALRQSEAITDAVLRRETLERVVGTWRHNDPAAADAWAQENKLTTPGQ